MKKGDIIVIIIGLALMLVMFVSYRIIIHHIGDDRTVTIRYRGEAIHSVALDETLHMEILVVDGEIIQIIDRNEDPEGELEIIGDHYNVILIQEGYISVTEADCPSQVDVNKGRTNRPYDVILCAPHYLEVVIIAEPVDDGLIDGEI